MVPCPVASGTKEIKYILQVGTFVIRFIRYCLKIEPDFCGLLKQFELIILVRYSPYKGGCF